MDKIFLIFSFVLLFPQGEFYHDILEFEFLAKFSGKSVISVEFSFLSLLMFSVTEFSDIVSGFISYENRELISPNNMIKMRATEEEGVLLFNGSSAYISCIVRCDGKVLKDDRKIPCRVRNFLDVKVPCTCMQ